jgi:16S rRNA (uracil1498-N3)-methyltransferase
MLKDAQGCDCVFFCYEGDGTVPIGKLLGARTTMPKHIALIIGSEGGFSLAETQRAEQAGFLLTGLGARILRTETASGFALACISCFTELS